MMGNDHYTLLNSSRRVLSLKPLSPPLTECSVMWRNCLMLMED